MVEWMKHIFDYHRYSIAGVLIAASIVIVPMACSPQAVSPTTGETVDREGLEGDYIGWREDYLARVAAHQRQVKRVLAEGEELEAEGERIGEQFVLRDEELQAQADAQWGAIEAVSEFAAPYLGSLAPLLVPALSVVAIGTGLDNRRKNNVIKRLKTNGQS